MQLASVVLWMAAITRTSPMSHSSESGTSSVTATKKPLPVNMIRLPPSDDTTRGDTPDTTTSRTNSTDAFSDETSVRPSSTLMAIITRPTVAGAGGRVHWRYRPESLRVAGMRMVEPARPRGATQT